MNHRIRHAAVVLGIVAAAATATPVGRAAGQPPAGPRYTPEELKALIAYSNASFAEKKAILAGVTGRNSARHGSAPLAGPWYTPEESKALIAYSSARAAASPASPGRSFSWGDAGIGAGVAIGAVLVALGLGLMLARARSQVRRSQVGA